MIKALTLRSFPSNMPWQECFRESRKSGFEGVEVNFDGRFHLDCPLKTLQGIRQVAGKHHIKIVSVYSRQQWQMPISSPNRSKREKGRKALLRLIEIADVLEAPSVLTIPGAVDNSILSKDVEILPYDEVYERVLNVLTDVAATARKKGIVLALENVPNKFLLSPLEMRDFIDKIGGVSVGCHFDVANCMYSGGYPEHWIRILGSRIKAVHLKDFRLAAGNLTGFTDIFEGDIRWDLVGKALADVGYDGALIAEVLPAYKHHPEILWKSASLAMDKVMADIRLCREKKYVMPAQ